MSGLRLGKRRGSCVAALTRAPFFLGRDGKERQGLPSRKCFQGTLASQAPASGARNPLLHCPVFAQSGRRFRTACLRAMTRRKPCHGSQCFPGVFWHARCVHPEPDACGAQGVAAEVFPQRTPPKAGSRYLVTGASWILQRPLRGRFNPSVSGRSRSSTGGVESPWARCSEW